MNTNTLRKISVTASLLVGLAGASSAQADIQNGALGAAASATDHYHVRCPELNTHRLAGTVMDLYPIVPPLVSMQFHKHGAAGNDTTNTTDPVDGDAFWSPVATLIGGSGVYDVLVDKTAMGAELYRINVHCVSMGGVHLPTFIAEVLPSQ